MPSKATTMKRPRGRPAHAPTPATRRQVAVAAGGGMRHLDIAIALGISRETLEKHYADELAGGATKRRLEVLNAMFAAAKKGSSSAAKVYLAAEPELAVPTLPADAGEAAPAKPSAQAVVHPVGKPLGKKEQAQVDAATAAAGTDWANLLNPPSPLQ